MTAWRKPHSLVSITALILSGGLGSVVAGDPAMTTPAAKPAAAEQQLPAPKTGRISVAFVLSAGATVIDFTGPWEVFQDVMVPGRGTSANDVHPFQLFTVAETRDPIRVTGGLQIVPDRTFDEAPDPDVIVVPAQGASPAMLKWLQSASKNADMTMAVCTGAFVLAQTGLLDGRAATTHHEFLDRLARSFPGVDVRRGVRYVEGRNIATAGGLTSGIDLALRVVERYFGHETAERTAAYMEHSSTGWHREAGHWDSGESAPPVARGGGAAPSRAVLRGLDPVLLSEGREVEGLDSFTAERGGYRYRFSSSQNCERFVASPERYEIQLAGACAYMSGRGAPPGSGDPDRFHVHDQRIYIFASDACRDGFKTDPGRYLPDPG